MPDSNQPADAPAADLTRVIEQLMRGEDLTSAQAQSALDVVMNGDASEVQTAAFLVALRVKGETRDEVTGLARSMRAHADEVRPTRTPLVDTAGTGGGRTTFNISTTAALVAAGAGAGVAKHGSRSATSRSGSADVLEALGVQIDGDGAAIEKTIDEIGFGFLFAPYHHPAMKHVAPVRKALKIHTIFNILGPLTNPAGAERQIIGVADWNHAPLIAGALSDLGSEFAWVVTSQDGLDELSIAADTNVIEVTPHGVREFTVKPEDAGLTRAASLDGLEGGEPSDNAATVTRVLAGETGPARDIVVLNAAATLHVAGLAADLAEGAQLAAQSIDSGAAAGVLERLVAATSQAVSS